MKLIFSLITYICLQNLVSAQAQATAYFTASATIIQPIGITTVSNLNFAKLDAQGGGDIILTPGDERIVQGDVELADASGVSAATFIVTGQDGFAFSISLPEEEFVLSNGSESMIIKDFTSSLLEGGNLMNGEKEVRIGATLNVKPNQTPGYYASREVMGVTVNYN